MVNTKNQASSTGKKFLQTPTLAKEKGSAVKPSAPARTKKENVSGLKTLADILSLLQEDARRYSEALAKADQSDGVTMIEHGRGIVFVLSAPEGHTLGTGKGHITLDGQPVTGWEE